MDTDLHVRLDRRSGHSRSGNFDASISHTARSRIDSRSISFASDSHFVNGNDNAGFRASGPDVRISNQELSSSQSFRNSQDSLSPDANHPDVEGGMMIRSRDRRKLKLQDCIIRNRGTGVKDCDETRPICNNCIRHRLGCVYTKPPPPLPPAASSPQTIKSNSSNPSTPEHISIHALAEDLSSASVSPQVDLSIPPAPSQAFSDDLPESSARRMLELRLLQTYIIHTSPTFPSCHNPETLNLWSVVVPKLAFASPNLLYAMFAIASLHLHVLSPSDMEIQRARQHYLSLALRHHQKGVASLNPSTADAVMFASILILNDAFSSLQVRCMKPYTLPTHWLQMARGTASVFAVALGLIRHDPNAKAMALLRTKPALTKPEERLNRPEIHPLFNAILTYPSPHISISPQNYSENGGYDPSIPPTHLTAYLQTLSYLSSIHLNIMQHEHPMATARRFTAFGLQVPKLFIDLVEERQPRALVIFAYYFAMATCLVEGGGPSDSITLQMKNGEDLNLGKTFWWMGAMVRREIGGISGILPGGWEGLMSWPRRVAGLE
ncbi:putative c6 transcription protein [Botrytis fragariae]|uniref:Putative c6 transcription protein n=1 Tax=Botrytis fragariae TaxID=1964551 RepID=A0A8H6ASY6_9HELO|nr:putative c6 transcription protein [Botrytis fragariae]KAF5872998.1 putative c6 transcription protein [Botrytis fragariae]